MNRFIKRHVVKILETHHRSHSDFSFGWHCFLPNGLTGLILRRDIARRHGIAESFVDVSFWKCAGRP